jgi:hypothetical protein
MPWTVENHTLIYTEERPNMSTPITLEFKRPSGDLAATGSDTMIYLDGRWGEFRKRIEIYAHVAYLRHRYPEKFRDLHFVGYTILGRSDYSTPCPHATMHDREAPAWTRTPVMSGWESGQDLLAWNMSL